MNFNKFSLFLCFVSVFFSCKEPDEAVSPTPINPEIATLNVSEVATDAVTLNGEILKAGTFGHTTFGFLLDTVSTLSLQSPGKIIVSTVPIEGKIKKTVYGLVPGKTYYAKMFFSNTKDTLLGEQISFKTEAQYITSFSSNVGFYEQEMKIKGRGFSSRLSENKLKFYVDEYTYSVDASIVAASDSVLTFKVPKYMYRSMNDNYKAKVVVTVNQTELVAKELFSFANTYSVTTSSAKEGDVLTFTIDNSAAYSNSYFFNDIKGTLKWTWQTGGTTEVGVEVPAGLTPGIVNLKVEATSGRPVLAKNLTQISIIQ